MKRKETVEESLANRIADLIQKHNGDGKTESIKIFNSEEADALAHLAKMHIENPGAIEGWVKFYITTQTMGKWGSTLQEMAKWAVYWVTLYIAVKAGIIQFITGVITKGGVQ